MSDPKRTYHDCARRKVQYKAILDQGGQLADEFEGNSILENMKQLESLVFASNQLNDLCPPTDRAEQTSEILLDVQVSEHATSLQN